MMHSTTSMMFSQSMEIASEMWAEFLMFSLAFCLYMFYVGSVRIGGKKPFKHKPNGLADQKPSLKQTNTSETSEYSSIVQAIQSGNSNLALDLISDLPQSAVSPLPAKIASMVLISLSKTSSKITDEMKTKLQNLGKSFDAKCFETAAVQAAHGQSAEVCHGLFVISSIAGVMKTERSVSLLMRAHAYDKSTFLALIDEVTRDGCGVELTRSLIMDLLSICKKYDHSEAQKLVLQRTPLTASDQVTRQAKYISSCGKDGRLADALAAFNAVKESGVPLTTFIYNCLIDACIKCNNPEAALQYFGEMKDSVAPDVVTYNTIIKGHLDLGRLSEVQDLVREMQKNSIEPSRITYQALLSVAAQSGSRKELWQIINDMEKANLQISSFACSLLLKGITNRSQSEELKKIVAIIDANIKVDPAKPVMDDCNFVLLQEACMKTNNLGLLWERLRLYCLQDNLVKLTAPICGSLIKAYGQAQNVERVWQMWFTMASRNVKATSVTLGCMVEALVVNRCTAEAWKLVNGIWDDPEQRPLINTVIYSNILKGFAMAKDNEKVAILYREMTERGIQCNTIAFNTILNSSALCGQMENVPKLLADMKAHDPPILPDVITYSTIIKGYCLSGQLDKGLDLMKEMKETAGLQPDEVMYNSLLDGCAKQSRLDTALQLLDEMKASGVMPSNYTLSIICKLMGRAKQVDKALSMVEIISKENGFRPNIQVYTCLIQACIYNRKLVRALSLHDDIVKNGFCCPDEKTYSSMVRGFLQMGCSEKASDVLRCAFHLPGHRLQETKGKPQGVQMSVVHDVIAQLGFESLSGQSIVNDLYEYRQISVKKADCKSAEVDLRKRRVGRSRHAA
eukprot:TRINITY_DN527_c0_g1_i1.p1 TRINITY_DN527_c0_g1~~TRINITY_DN527_c0_g1_i1.p1  ORF type:complete len:852 (+),score=156.48 TRINITY_DN527_c0_g1_i1:101-2656(+)